MVAFVMVTVQRYKSEWWEVALVGLVSWYGRFRRRHDCFRHRRRHGCLRRRRRHGCLRLQ